MSHLSFYHILNIVNHQNRYASKCGTPRGYLQEKKTTFDGFDIPNIFPYRYATS